jgi:PadR family transcriptional regulator
MQEHEIRLTQPALKVLRTLLDTPRERRSGADLSKATGVGAGTLYPLLARLEGVGWVISKWESVDPSKVGRPRRRFYLLTGLGKAKCRNALAELQFNSARLVWTT